MTQKGKNIFWNIITNTCRFILAGVFLFSGFVKAVDPQGTALKIKDYAVAMGMSEQRDSAYFTFVAFTLLAFEFIIGTTLLLGIRRKISSLLAVAFLCIMTPLTLYLAIANPVSDCGCFGDAWVLTNWQTFFKNLILLAAAIVVFRKKMRMPPFAKHAFQSLAPLYTLIYILLYAAYCHTHLPSIDFRPYKIGTDILKATHKGDENGDFLDFSLMEPTALEDVTDSILLSHKYLFLLITPRIELADESDIDLINELYDYSVENGYGFYAVTSSDETLIKKWRDRTGADYPFLKGDNTMLLTMIRSNPGLLLLKDGVILNKWHHSMLPNEYDLANRLENSPQLTQPKPYNIEEKIGGALLWYICPLLGMLLFDLIILQPIERARKNKREKNKQDKLNNNSLKTNKMRKNIVAGNWKMNKTLQEGIELAKELNAALANETLGCDVVICTPFIHLASVSPLVDAAKIGVGAENCADKVSGAYTGEVSAAMVASTGAQYVILGHSERRAYYGETAEILKEKVQLALANGLTPIFCIGEVLEEREAGKQNEVVFAQLSGSLFDLSAEDFSKIVLAYEPVWAIGTGKTASAEQAEEIHAYIRSTIVEKYGKEIAENTSILYGGSCKASNAKELFAKADVDGGLIGGAALKVEDFKGIIDAFKA